MVVACIRMILQYDPDVIAVPHSAFLIAAMAIKNNRHIREDAEGNQFEIIFDAAGK